MHETPTTPAEPDTLQIRPWADPVIDTLGHDPRSLYAELFWLPTLGPTALLLIRHLAHRFDLAGVDDGVVVELPVSATAQALGLGPRSTPNSPLVRSLGRLVQFDLAIVQRDGTVAVRRTLPPLNRRHVQRLPAHLAEEHQRWTHDHGAPREIAARRARTLAMRLTELGNDVDIVERVLHHMGFQPHLCRESATWAHAAHRSAERDDTSAGEAA
jgi:hypothetical protein